MSNLPQKDGYVTPEYLLAHGFFKYNTPEEGDVYEIPFNEGDIHFREIEFDRRVFVVTFSERLQHDGYFASVSVQEDAGCGFITIPFPWWDLPIEYFESVYYGIRGERPKLNPATFANTEYEVIKPKQIE